MAVTLCHECQEDVRYCQCADNPDRERILVWEEVLHSFRKFGYYPPPDGARKNHMPYSEKDA